MLNSNDLIKKIKEQIDISISESDMKDYSYIVSPPVIRMNEDIAYLATFMIFIDSNVENENINNDKILAKRPIRYDAFDINTGEFIIENIDSREYEFSNMPYDKLLSISFTNEQLNENLDEIEDKLNKELDTLRNCILNNKIINIDNYKKYLELATTLLPIEYQKFLYDLSDIDINNINEQNNIYNENNIKENEILSNTDINKEKQENQKNQEQENKKIDEEINKIFIDYKNKFNLLIKEMENEINKYIKKI